MKLADIADFTTGAFTNRLETTAIDENILEIEMLSLKQFNETLGVAYRISNSKGTKIKIPKGKLDPHLLTDTASLILNVQSQKVALMPEKYSGLLLTNNFLKIQFNADVDLAFFEWYFNEHPFIQKQLAVMSEGSVISSLKLSHLKELSIELPSFQKQQIIGRIAQLKRYREILQTERMDLQRQFIQQQLVQSIEKNYC